jgi:hypothetical protein
MTVSQDLKIYVLRPEGTETSKQGELFDFCGNFFVFLFLTEKTCHGYFINS